LLYNDKLTSGTTKSGKPFGLDPVWIFSPSHPAQQLGTAPTPALWDEDAKGWSNSGLIVSPRKSWVRHF